ncbi:NADP-dependent oxidoreductase [Actinacidiphila yeochonensis]|uniref:NADP-dependent oxidoreductase n=1 Tax=Actinacidiphila yeochonensis TaxID=89050 RepID=UPI0005670721|nr:NADP-dependent oxidoreductase [Actinacidiphila yeochonensis]
MRTLRFHSYGSALDVLRVDETEPPRPGPGQIRVRVQACGLTPADWALCGGLFGGDLPRGIGLEVSGTVDGLGDGVTGVKVGDPVIAPVPFTGPTAGASELVVVDFWTPRPAGLDPVRAAALPMAVETAYRGLDELGIHEGATVLVHGTGSAVGYAAAQIALRRGARVITTAGETYADALREVGAEVTSHGEGMAERVTALAGGPVDPALDTALAKGAASALGSSTKASEQVLRLTGFARAGKPGARVGSAGGMDALRYDVLGEYAQLAADGLFSVPVARHFPLEDWRTAAELSLSGRACGKLVLRFD